MWAYQFDDVYTDVDLSSLLPSFQNSVLNIAQKVTVPKRFRLNLWSLYRTWMYKLGWDEK